MIGRAIDSLVEAVSPAWAISRARARHTMDKIRGHEAAGRGSKTLRDIRTSHGPADLTLMRDLPSLRARSHHAYDNTGVGVAIIEGLVALVMSTGIGLMADTGDTENDKRLNDEWAALMEVIDATGLDNGDELSRLQFRGELLNGTSLAQLAYPSEYIGRGHVPFAALAFEPDQLSSAPVESLAPGTTFRNGIEVDAMLRPVAYHVLEHPGDPFAFMGSQAGRKSSRRIAASEIIQTYERLRAGATQGRPILSPVLLRVLQDDDVVRFELDTARSGALWGVAVTGGSGAPMAGLAPGAGESEIDADGNQKVITEAGDILTFSGNEKAEVLANPRPSQAITAFRNGTRGDFAGGTRINQAWIDHDNSRANYSSMTAGKAMDERLHRPAQLRFGRQFWGQAYTRALPLMSANARVPMPSAKDPRARRMFSRYKLNPDGFPSADELKAVSAAFARVVTGMSTWEKEISKTGEDPAAIHKQLAREMNSPIGAIILAAAKAAQLVPAGATDKEPENDPTKQQQPQESNA